MDNYTDAQLISLHRNWTISTGEFIAECRRRGWSEWRIETAAKLNVALRHPEVEKEHWIH